MTHIQTMHEELFDRLALIEEQVGGWAEKSGRGADMIRWNTSLQPCVNGSQLAKMKKSIPDMSLP